MLKFRVLYKPPNFNKNELLRALRFITRANQCEILVQNNKDLLEDVIFELKRKRCDPFRVLNEWIKEEDTSPPLELLWILEKENLLSFTTYLYFHADYCSTVVFCINNAISGDLEDSEGNEIKFILTQILGIILTVRSTSDFKHLSEEILHGTISEVARHLDSTSPTINWNYFSDLKQLTHTLPDVVNDFARLHVIKCLTYEGSSFETSYVISNHTKLWTSQKMPDDLKCFIKEFVFALEAKILLNEIDSAVLQENFNWKFLLYIISIFVQDQHNSEILKGAVDNWFRSSIDEKNKYLLYVALIIARHCCAEKARYFTNYPTWFGSVPLKSVGSYTFFFDCLSQIVPNEPPLFLKIHVNKVPSVPSSCQSIVVDYIDLAKTRLSDLNETTDYIGLFNDYHETDEEGQEADIRRAISLFEENKEIPKPLLEASVFRRQYYEKTFLKRLLSVSGSDDPSRVPLIKKLYSAGKIPSTMYRSWSSLSLSVS